MATAARSNAATKPKPAAVETAPVVDDEVWRKLQSENHVPPLEFKGLSLKEPSKTQIDAWHAATSIEEGERALFGDLYDAVHAVFAHEPLHVWENFNALYLLHMFGTTGDEALKG